jgi:hypothetical protein
MLAVIGGDCISSSGTLAKTFLTLKSSGADPSTLHAAVLQHLDS